MGAELAIVDNNESKQENETAVIPPIPMLEPLPPTNTKPDKPVYDPLSKPIKRKRTYTKKSKKSKEKKVGKKQRKRKDIIEENEKALTDEDRKEMQRICGKLGIDDGNYNVGVCLYHFNS